MNFEQRYEVPVSSAQSLFLPDTFVTGYEDITRMAEPLIIEYLHDPDTWQDDTVAPQPGTGSYRETLAKKFSEFSFIGIVLAGLADGVNPCAIATMIFLISFLATQKRSRKEVLIVGLCFTGAVFITYLLIGIGAFNALSFLNQTPWISMTIKWTAVIVAASIGVLCFRDAIVYAATGKIKQIKLQLPTPVKMRIHRVISGHLSGSGLILGALITGFLVTLLEAVCTGQVYLPTIVLMTREHGLRARGWAYLILYNFLFVLPLLIIMILAYFGLTWEKLAKKTQHHMVFLKTLLGVVLLVLALFLALAM
jgi:cytochrome c biogenesis protein CcdA